MVGALLYIYTLFSLLLIIIILDGKDHTKYKLSYFIATMMIFSSSAIGWMENIFLSESYQRWPKEFTWIDINNTGNGEKDVLNCVCS